MRLNIFFLFPVQLGSTRSLMLIFGINTSCFAHANSAALRFFCWSSCVDIPRHLIACCSAVYSWCMRVGFRTCVTAVLLTQPSISKKRMNKERLADANEDWWLAAWQLQRVNCGLSFVLRLLITISVRLFKSRTPGLSIDKYM